MASRPNHIWAVIDPIVENKVSIRLNNSSSQRVSFWVYGVTPPKVGFVLDGNTQWSTVLVKDPKSSVIEIRRDGLLGETLVYKEVGKDY